jgi:hypothetical protein
VVRCGPVNHGPRDYAPAVSVPRRAEALAAGA